MFRIWHTDRFPVHYRFGCVHKYQATHRNEIFVRPLKRLCWQKTQSQFVTPSVCKSRITNYHKHLWIIVKSSPCDKKNNFFSGFISRNFVFLASATSPGVSTKALKPLVILASSCYLTLWNKNTVLSRGLYSLSSFCNFSTKTSTLQHIQSELLINQSINQSVDPLIDQSINQSSPS